MKVKGGKLKTKIILNIHHKYTRRHPYENNKTKVITLKRTIENTHDCQD